MIVVSIIVSILIVVCLCMPLFSICMLFDKPLDSNVYLCNSNDFFIIAENYFV